ncbi:MAG: SUMF1/EgtB/PvdO family nonheme iron enzyme [Planctomycetes bacterium]|nr:SUMF1/EgtB/PvdO family nonheme iron enzyme [Planctomycetota bacterium]
MTKPTDAEVESLVLLCLESEDPESRLAELAADDPSMRERARRVLARFHRLDEAPVAVEPPSQVPDKIGPYQIVRELGRGGMGAVYLAEQREPVKRLVALKLIRGGLNSEEIHRRFLSERQALARMTHPGIARMFDAGISENGLPYFVMEYIEGSSIVEFADANELSIDDRIELLIEVCEAVQYAHQKGVIHRDLKPSNILVTEVVDRRLPKIIDFGVAKATSVESGEATLHTMHGQVLGTPEYMSPEQCGDASGDVDTRTDVYSLGVLLYELVSGQLPFDSATLRTGNLADMQRVLREVEPEPPSRRVATAGSDDLASRRATTRAILFRRLSGDLDWIVLKALEKDPERRYSSVSEFAADLQRYLEHEAVLAGRPSSFYRLRKLVRRHRVAVTSGALLVAALAAGLATTLWQNRIAKANERTANDNLVKYRQMRDAPIADELLAEARDELWPLRPEKVPVMEDWLSRAEELVARESRHRAILDELSTRRLPPPVEVEDLRKKRSKLTVDEAQQSAMLDEDVERMSRAEAAGRKIPATAKERTSMLRVSVRNLRTSIVQLDEQIERMTWQFGDYDDRFVHGVVRRILAAIDELRGDSGRIADVRARLQSARTVAERSITSHQKEWEATIDAIAAADGIAAHGLYAKTPRLEPQIGLVPLGADPVSKFHEFAVVDSGTVPKRRADGMLELDERSAIVVVLIPAMEFTMGSQTADANAPGYAADANWDESPRNQVKLDAYFIGKHEVTQPQWEQLRGGRPSLYGPGYSFRDVEVTDLHPVTDITWEDAARVLTHMGLRLPTEAQWECAARAGTDTAFSTGQDDPSLKGKANLLDLDYIDWTGEQAVVATLPWRDGFVLHAPIGSFPANAFGLHDVHGNVWEWCLDVPVEYTYPARQSDGLRREIIANRGRVARGGSWRLGARAARSAFRIALDNLHKGDDGGVRVARPVE